MIELYKYRKGEKVVDRYKRIYGMTDEEAQEALRRKQEKARRRWLESRGLAPRSDPDPEEETLSRMKRIRMKQKQRLEYSSAIFMGLSRMEFRAVENMDRKMRDIIRSFTVPEYEPPKAIRQRMKQEEKERRRIEREASVMATILAPFSRSGRNERMPLWKARLEYPHLFTADRFADGMERLRRLRIEREKSNGHAG